jgi:GNAT superfamily N-acetyltransferase
LAQRAAESSISASRIWSVARAHLALFGAIDDAEMLLREKMLLGLTGGPTPDFNMCLADDSPNLEAVLAEAVERTRARSLPAIFMLSVQASQKLAGRHDELGLTPAGDAPLMVFTARPPAPDFGYDAREVSDESDLKDVAELISKAFDLDREWVGRTFASRALVENSSGVGFYLVTDNGKPLSTVTMTGAGPVIGIWSMATDPEFQRRGAGRTALLGAMAHRRSLGADAFYLIATPAGKPLYDSVGFRTLETFPMYVLGGGH